MRKWFATGGLLIVLIASYMAWPFFGLYQLSGALYSGNVDRALSHVDAQSVRRSIIFQLVDDGLRGTRIEQKLGDFQSRFAANAIKVEMDRQLAALLSPRQLLDLIVEGRLPESLQKQIAQARKENAPMSVGSLFHIPHSPLSAIRSWHFVAFNTFEVKLETGQGKEDWVELRLKREGFQWKLNQIDLPPSVLARWKPLIDEKLRKIGL